jgi:hypothetical protein
MLGIRTADKLTVKRGYEYIYFKTIVVFLFFVGNLNNGKVNFPYFSNFQFSPYFLKSDPVISLSPIYIF